MKNNMLPDQLKCAFLIFASLSVSITSADDSSSETLPIVMRVSGNLIQDLLDEEIEAPIQFQENILGAQVWGNANGKAKLELKMDSNDKKAVFEISARGTAQGYACGSRGCFRVNGNLTTPFTAVHTVRFDGQHFHAESLRVNARVHTCITSVRTHRDKVLGRLVSKVATPHVKNLVPVIEREAIPVANRCLADFVKTESDSLIKELNQLTPIEMTLQKLYPETVDWRYRLSTTKTHLVIAYGSPEGQIPTLPETDKRPINAGIELWVRTTPEEAKFLETATRWNVSNDLLKKFLSDSPEVHQILEDSTVTAIGPWVVIAIGLPEK